MTSPESEYLTIEEACARYGVSGAQLRQLLRRHGLGEFMRAAMRKQVLLRREDLEALLRLPRQPGRKGVA